MNPKRHKTKFITLRYGNVLRSSGSVVPTWLNQIKNNKKIPITDPQMTRFSITMEDALEFVLNASLVGQGSEIFVPKLHAYTIMDLMKAITDLLNDPGYEIVGVRPGEKLHEILINEDEIRYTWELEDNYIIFNPQKSNDHILENYKGIKKVENLTEYSSKTAKKIPVTELKEIITKSGMLEK